MVFVPIVKLMVICLDATGKCSYITYNREVAEHPEARKVSVMDKPVCAPDAKLYALDLWSFNLSSSKIRPIVCRMVVTNYLLQSVFKIISFHRQ